MAVTATGDRSVAASTSYGDVHTGDVRRVELAPGLVQPPDGIGPPPTGAHNLPRPKNPVFVGRAGLLTAVRSLFAPPAEGHAREAVPGPRAAVGQAITGLGGIGKSELALQYAASRIGPGAVVWWADAENAETFELSLADLTYLLQPAATAAGWTTTEAAAWATGWLQARTGWFLVLDNVENPDVITGLLGKLSAGDILITTRRDIPWRLHGVTPLALDVLPRPAAIQLLHDAAGSADDHDAADAIVAELGDLPLALQQAGAYVAALRLPLATYLHKLRSETAATLSKIAPGSDSERAVARVFQLTVETLGQVKPAAVDVLRALAWLAPTSLPRPVVAHLPVGTQGSGGHAASDDVDDLLALLASYSVITLTADTVGIHRVLQATVREYDCTKSGDDALTAGQVTALTWLRDAVPDRPERYLACRVGPDRPSPQSRRRRTTAHRRTTGGPCRAWSQHDATKGDVRRLPRGHSPLLRVPGGLRRCKRTPVT